MAVLLATLNDDNARRLQSPLLSCGVQTVLSSLSLLMSLTSQHFTMTLA